MSFGTIEVNVQDILEIANNFKKCRETAAGQGAVAALNILIKESSCYAMSLEWDDELESYYVRYDYLTEEERG